MKIRREAPLLAAAAALATMVATLPGSSCARASPATDDGAIQSAPANAKALDAPKFNVVLAVIDTLRADHLSCYGYPRQTSPNLDRFALDAVRFERAYTAWPETCPSMAAMLSGMPCQSNGVVIDTPKPISPKLDLLPEILQANGWATAAFVMNSVLPKKGHYDQGFDRYVEVWNRSDNPQGRRDVDLACAWLKENAERPFFLWLHCVEPHAPYEGKKPERFVGDASYDPTRRVVVRPAERKFEAVGGIPGVSRIEGHDELAYYVARYDSDVFDADAKFGQLLRQIDSLGIADRTLVIFVADHGEGFGEHDYFWHGAVPFDETAHVPLVIRAPGIPKGVATDVVSTVDLMPTVLEFLGVPVPGVCEGRSLLPVMRDPAAATGRIVFSESGDERRGRNWQRSVRDLRFKLVYTPSRNEREKLDLEEWMLFDVAADPGETKNLVAEQPEVFERLKGELMGWMRTEALFESPTMELTPEEEERIRKTGYAVDDVDDEGSQNDGSDRRH